MNQLSRQLRAINRDFARVGDSFRTPPKPQVPHESLVQIEERLRWELDQARRQYDGYFRLASEAPDPEHIGPLDEARQQIIGLLSAIKAIRGLQ